MVKLDEVPIQYTFFTRYSSWTPILFSHAPRRSWTVQVPWFHQPGTSKQN